MSKLNSIEAKFANGTRLIIESRFVRIEGYKPKMAFEIYLQSKTGLKLGQEYFSLDDESKALSNYNQRLIRVNEREKPIDSGTIEKVFIKD